MSDNLDISYLIKNMNPILTEGEYVFAETEMDDSLISALAPLSHFRFNGKSLLIVSKEAAEKNDVKYKSVFNLITVSVTSSPEEYEFLAVISGVFADQGIKVNFVSGISNHYLFVPVNKTKDAMQLLHELVTDF